VTVEKDDQTEYILQMARQLGLTLPEGEIARVKMLLGVLERAAGQVRDAPLPGDAIAAAVFCPAQLPKK
jgi:hypothetical protein